MTGDRPRRRRRKARQGSTSTATHISSLGEDVVLEIFLRLSSLATLVRAAPTCRAWRRAVASSPDFRRRFRALHPAPPLLGIFINSSDDDPDALYRPPCVPSFVPGGFRAWDLAAAVRGGDFLLTSLSSLLERSTENSDALWQILDCHGGRILLTDAHDGDNPLIVLNPLMRSSAHEFRYPGPAHYTITTRFICQDEEPLSSFRVVLLAYSGSTLQPSIYSLDKGEWSALPDVDIPFPARSADHGTSSGESSKKIWIDDEQKMHANGFVYWIYMWCGETDGRRYLISLDTTTMEFSFAALPQCPRRTTLWLTFQGGETEDDAACIVYSDGSSMVGVVKHTRGDDGVDRWVPDRVLRLELDGRFGRFIPRRPYCWNKLCVVAVRDGYVYFATSEVGHDPKRRCWFMSLCLATMEVEKLFERRYDGDAGCVYHALATLLVS